MSIPEPVTLSLAAMATRFEIVLYGADSSRLRAAAEEAFEEIAALDRQLSFYNPLSEISRINTTAAIEPVRVEPRLFGLLERAFELTVATDGAFDVTIPPLMRAWGLAGGEGRVPTEEEIEEAMLVVGMQMVELNAASHSVYFEREGTQIDLGAIGKGYAIDRAIETLLDNGIESALLHGGTSTIYAIGSIPGDRPWRVGIHDPAFEPKEAGRLVAKLDPLDLRDCSLSVSAVHGKSFTRDGKRYGHIIDPRTGRPSKAAALTGVWGPNATETDALSTALLVMGGEGLNVMAERFPEYRGLAIDPKA